MPARLLSQAVELIYFPVAELYLSRGVIIEDSGIIVDRTEYHYPKDVWSPAMGHYIDYRHPDTVEYFLERADTHSEHHRF